MSEDRAAVPLSIKRELRRRCGFGCVMCGAPVFDYEHIEGIGATGHDPEHMTLLCKFHHGEKTAGRLAVSTVRKANADPFNCGKSFTSVHPLFFEPTDMRLDLGNVCFRADPKTSQQSFGVIVDGMPVIAARVEDNHLRLDLDLRDADNRPLMIVRGGELRFALANWDIRFTGKKLEVLSAARQVVLRLRLYPPDRIHVELATWFHSHVPIWIGDRAVFEGVQVPTFLVANLSYVGGALAVGPGDAPGFVTGLRIDPGPRFYGSSPARPGGSFSTHEDWPAWREI